MISHDLSHFLLHKFHNLNLGYIKHVKYHHEFYFIFIACKKSYILDVSS